MEKYMGAWCTEDSAWMMESLPCRRFWGQNSAGPRLVTRWLSVSLEGGTWRWSPWWWASKGNKLTLFSVTLLLIRFLPMDLGFTPWKKQSVSKFFLHQSLSQIWLWLWNPSWVFISLWECSPFLHCFLRQNGFADHHRLSRLCWIYFSL